MKYILSLIIASACMVFVAPQAASAATLQLTSDKDTFAIGDRFAIDVKIDSEGTGVNAAQGTVQAPAEILEVIQVDKTGSVFNFWLTEPTFSNGSGQVNFIGGSTNGFSGRSLQVLRITYRVKGSGKADIVFTDGAVTASDGSGTNILAAMKGLSITSTPSATTETIVPKPTQITRIAETAKQVPSKPEIRVAGYEDPTIWHAFSNRFAVTWQLPKDVTDVATAITKDPAFVPTRSEGLFDNKIFAAPGEGISYLHVRFKNNVGWGPLAHHRIAVDTTPPSTFRAHIREGEATDVPNPTIEYAATDGLSGIRRYFIRQNGGEQRTLGAGPYTMELQKPGKYNIQIGAEDNAGNIIENSLQFEIRPIEPPKIVSVIGQVFVGEGNLNIVGTALPKAQITATLKRSEGSTEEIQEMHADGSGNWAMRFDKPLKKGTYIIEVVAQDEKGASSYPVTSDPFAARARPILILGPLQVTEHWLLGMLLAMLLGGAGAGWVAINAQKQQQARKALIVQRDIVNIFANVQKDIEKIMEKHADKNLTDSDAVEIKHLAEQARENIEKVKKYIIKDIGEINK